MNKYTALIMDLKKSRKYSSKNRNEIQDYIFHVIRVLNQVFESSLEKDFFSVQEYCTIQAIGRTGFHRKIFERNIVESINFPYIDNSC